MKKTKKIEVRISEDDFRALKESAEFLAEGNISHVLRLLIRTHLNRFVSAKHHFKPEKRKGAKRA